MRYFLGSFLLWLVAGGNLLASDPAFDLQGPRVDMRVKRGDQTLPIGEVPNLMPGDRLWIHPDLPESQSAHFVLVVAFLRGATNPPPPEWLTRVETWSREVRSEGIFIIVPAEAQQAILFLAPETGGDFSTLRNAVRGKPGAFVRATQDLRAASMDRMRLESYLEEVRSQNDPKSLKVHTELAARSLGIRLEQQCFDKPTDQQVPCLSAHTDGTVLEDTGNNTVVDQLTTGNTRDLMNQISSSSMVGGGSYSPYIGAIVDTARILSSLHTAHYQYIPALALSDKDSLNLRLSVPPSFLNPKSVVVVALPPVGPAHLPILRPVNPSDSYCAQKTDLVLPAEGAPLVYATHMARELSLHIDTKNGPVEVKAHADSSQGGFVLNTPVPPLPEEELIGALHGKWGFDNWEGPRFRLSSSHTTRWTVAASDQSALVVGREDVLHLENGNSTCTERIEMQTGSAKPVKLNWKSPHPDSLEVAIPLKEASPGTATLNFYQYGQEKPDSISLHTYAEAASLEGFIFHVGDQKAVLKGNRLDEVAKATLGGILWTPTQLKRVQEFDQLTLNTTSQTTALEQGKKLNAAVFLQDGRELKIPFTVQPQRPQLILLNRSVQEENGAQIQSIHLGKPDDLPMYGHLVFFLRSLVPSHFPRSQKIELAAEDGSFHTLLNLTDGGLILEDNRTVMGRIDPQERLGMSAFGPIHVRAISEEGIASDWIPLGTLVRLPGLKDLRCPRTAAKPCALTGTNLFLVDSFSTTKEFENPIEVPVDFTGTLIMVPHPVTGQLYLKLRDDPETVQTLTLPVMNSGSAVTTPAKSNPSTLPSGASVQTPEQSAVEEADATESRK